MTFLGHKETCMGLLSTAVALFCGSYFTGFLPYLLTEKYYVDEDKVSLFYLCLTVPSFIACLLLPVLFKKVPRRLQFVLAFVGMTIGSLLMGPTLLDDSLAVISLGMGVIGVV